MRRRLLLEELEDRCMPSALLVQMESGVEWSQSYPLAEELAIDGLYRISGDDGWLSGVKSGLEKSAGVSYVEWDQIVSIQTVPNDPSYTNGSLWGLSGANGIRVAEAWDHTTGSTTITVGVIDTGIDYRHPDLYLNIWINQDEMPSGVRSTLVDSDADGLITFWDLNAPVNAGILADADGDSRITGYDIIAAWSDNTDADSNGYRDDLIGWDWVNNDNNPFDDNSMGHGTHVAGTIGGIGNNGVGVVGVNWKTQIAALKFLSSGGSGSTSNAALAITYAANEGIEITNNSWGGGGFSQTLSNAITTARNADSLFVAAAGNNGSNNDAAPFYPASYTQDNIIAVAAIQSDGAKASFSNYGQASVDIGAPGSGIYSTLPNGNYGFLNGTSMASPHVAGAAALAWAAHPDWTYTQVRDLILDSARWNPNVNGLVATDGVLDVAAAFGHPLPVPTTFIIDSGELGFSTSGPNWASYINGFQNDHHFAPTGNGSNVATWTFNVPDGIYRVAATWPVHENRATNTPFTIYDNQTVLGTVSVNQELTPNDFSDQGSGWENLGEFTIQSGRLIVRLSNAANEWVIADGIRVERIGDAPPPPPVTVWIIDNDDTGSDLTFGNWQYYSAPVAGFGNDQRYSAARGNSGFDSIYRWIFNVTPGVYRVSATWIAHPNRATDAPFTVQDRTIPIGMVRMNQELAPNDFSDQGVMWEDIGTFQIIGDELRVALRNDANEWVIADAIRIERVGDGPAEREIQVLDYLIWDVADIADGVSTSDFGTTAVGSPILKAYTIRNLGQTDLTLGPISVPPGFTLVQSVPSALHAGEMASFQIRFDAAGDYSGQLTFITNDADENQFSFAVRGNVLETAPDDLNDQTSAWEGR